MLEREIRYLVPRVPGPGEESRGRLQNKRAVFQIGLITSDENPCVTKQHTFIRVINLNNGTVLKAAEHLAKRS